MCHCLVDACRIGDVIRVDAALRRCDSLWHDAIVVASSYGHLLVVERLLQDTRIDPSAYKSYAAVLAAQNGHVAVVDRLLEDPRVDPAGAIKYTRRADRTRFEYRERFAEICIALQELSLPAWVTVKILKACKPWSTLKLHQKWKLVCAVKHFHD